MDDEGVCVSDGNGRCVDNGSSDGGRAKSLNARKARDARTYELVWCLTGWED